MGDAFSAGFVTRAAYARARRSERDTAAAVAGLDAGRLICLGIADQEATMRLCEIADHLRRLFAARAVRTVITHAYEGGHPDHDATAFAVAAACARLRRDEEWAPIIVEMAGYHAGPAGLEAMTFLPAREATELTLRLTASQRAAKQRLFDCYPTQARTLAQLGLEAERFRPAPRYDFARAPHPGALWYERFDWGVTGKEWRKYAAAALADMLLAPRDLTDQTRTFDVDEAADGP